MNTSAGNAACQRPPSVEWVTGWNSSSHTKRPTATPGHIHQNEDTTMTTATRNAFNYGLTESLAVMTIPAMTTAARWAVLAYDVATSARARQAYQWVGSMAVALGQLTFWSVVWCYAKTAAWAEEQVQASLNAEANHVPDAGNMVSVPTEVSDHRAAVPAVMAAPAAVRVIPVAPATPTSAELRRQCQAAGIRWRNAHGKGRHLTKTEMLAALP